MSIPRDYEERVYAGVLGKIIGVYLGRPFEGWTYEEIMAKLGTINYYVHKKQGVPLVVTDDDIAGTFTFLRALEDYHYSPDLTPAQIGQSWLNYIIEQKTILWWGGMGNSTEHTAYLRLKKGIPAPQSGSRALNGKTVSEQIGSQIFIDGWAMVSPGDPQRAADLAGRAASVSHDGEAIYGAQIIAAMEALAFVEPDLNRLIDTALTFIPRDSIIFRMINDLREWHAQEADWQKTRLKIVERYGYDRYGGNCHMIPNHALIFLSLLYGEDDFQKSLMIVNTSGWDTDCNSGNVGCLLVIKNGLAGIEHGPDWRSEVADRLYLSTADGGRSITDAVSETYRIVNAGRALAGMAPLLPKNGARFHFELPGSVQGFMADTESANGDMLRLKNSPTHSQSGHHSLALQYQKLAPGVPVRVKTATFIPAEARDIGHYELLASPTLYSGQNIAVRIAADENNQQNVTAQVYISVYGENDNLQRFYGPGRMFSPASQGLLEWTVPDTGGTPIAEVGIEINASAPADGTLYLDYLTWDGVPRTRLAKPYEAGQMWRRAWVNAIDSWDARWPETYRLVQNEGRGMIIQGCREWDNYSFSADLTPHILSLAGIAVHVQGLQRYYALVLRENNVLQLIKVLDGEHILAQKNISWDFEKSYHLCVQVAANHLVAGFDERVIFDVFDHENPLQSGAVGLLCEAGRMAVENVQIAPLPHVK